MENRSVLGFKGAERKVFFCQKYNQKNVLSVGTTRWCELGEKLIQKVS